MDSEYHLKGETVLKGIHRAYTRFLASSAQTGDFMTKSYGFKHFDFRRSGKVRGVKFGELPRNNKHVCERMT